MSLTVIHTPNAPAAIGPYSQAIAAPCGKMIFCSGQIPIDPATGEFNSQEVGPQAEQVMKNLEQVLKAAGATFAQVVKTTIFMTDLKDFGTVNEIYGRSFPNNPPARETVQVAGLPRGCKVEIGAIAMI